MKKVKMSEKRSVLKIKPERRGPDQHLKVHPTEISTKQYISEPS
jgi:hypothetical protein